MLLNGSPAQKRWLNLWKEEVPLSHISIQLNQSVNPEIIQERTQSIVEHHDVLRFVLSDETYQRFQILNDANRSDSCWKGIIKANTGQVIKQWKEEGFDIKSNSFLKIALIENEEKQCLLICCPSIVLDQLSILEFARMLLGETAIDEEEIPHSEFSSWWNETLLERANDDVAFWDEWVKNELPLNNHPWISYSKGVPLTYESSQDINALLNQIKTTTGFSEEIILLSVWIVLTSRWQEEDNFAIGELLDGRSLPELKTILGPVTRLVPYKVNVSTFNSFTDLLQFVYDHREETIEYQDYYIQNKKKGDFLPFQFQYRKAPHLFSGQITSWNSDIEPCFLKLSANKCSSSVQLQIQFESQKLSQETAKKVIRDFKNLLTSIVENPSCSIKALQKSEAFQFDAQKEYSNQTFGELDILSAWGLQVKNHPDRIALTDQKASMTYKEVSKQIDLLAKKLTIEGIGFGDHVLLQIPKSSEAIIAILAIQKRNAAYLPIAIDTPQKRIEKIIKDSNIACILSYTNGKYQLKSNRSSK